MPRQQRHGAQNFIERQRNSDDASRANENFFRFAAQAFSGFRDSAQRGSVPRGAGGAIRISRVYHHRAHSALRRTQMRLGNQYGSGNDKILSEHSGRRSGNVAGEDGEIERAGFFQAAGGRGEAKAAGKRGFGESVLHSRRSHGVSAMLTEGTSDPPRH